MFFVSARLTDIVYSLGSVGKTNESTMCPAWQVKTLYTIVILLVLITVSSADTQPIVVGVLDGIDPETQPPSIRIGLALSGGGARGLCAVGILRAKLQHGDAANHIRS